MLKKERFTVNNSVSYPLKLQEQLYVWYVLKDVIPMCTVFHVCDSRVI